MRARIQKISKYAPSIFQGKLDFHGRRPGFSLTAEHPAERLFLRLLISAVVVLACAYAYFVGATILNVIARKEALADSVNLATAVSKLEREYFAISQRVGPEDGTRLGLSPVSKTIYVHRPGNAALSDVARNEI
ncbi:hypothetical protein HYW59_03030 [Candidatus Kaiserbacteria bacterium]|nr:hypothetical protein [Candidatus Kaiserbacteria bacterium]